MFQVQAKQCETCIYRKDSPLSIKKLENPIRDRIDSTQFTSHRVCHHSDEVCCAGFWARHKDKFNLGRIAQRLGVVEFVHVDKFKER